MDKTLFKNLLRDNTYPLPCIEWDVVPPFQTLKLYHANREMNMAQIDLIVCNIENERANIAKFLTVDELAVRKRRLRNLFFKANKVVKENRASMYRFHEKIYENTHEMCTLSDQIENVRGDIRQYSMIKCDMEKHVSQYSYKYEKFLELVAQTTPEFNSIQDILNRHETLENCRKDCNRILKEELDEASAMREEMLRVVEEKSSLLKKLDNSLVMLQLRRKSAKERRVHWEHVLQKVRACMNVAAEQAEALRHGCQDLHLQVGTRLGELPPSTATPLSVEDQLHFVQNSILFYKEVIRIATAIKQDVTEMSRSGNDSRAINSLISNLLDDKMRNKLLRSQLNKQ